LILRSGFPQGIFENAPQKLIALEKPEIFLIKITTNERFLSHNNPLNYLLSQKQLNLKLRVKSAVQFKIVSTSQTGVPGSGERGRPVYREVVVKR
jgi:hypothetical protein